jgi:hypothetical protein
MVEARQGGAQLVFADPKHPGAEKGFWPGCIPGAKLCAIIPISIAFFRAAVWQLREGAGLVLARASFCLLVSFDVLVPCAVGRKFQF